MNVERGRHVIGNILAVAQMILRLPFSTYNIDGVPGPRIVDIRTPANFGFNHAVVTPLKPGRGFALAQKEDGSYDVDAQIIRVGDPPFIADDGTTIEAT